MNIVLIGNKSSGKTTIGKQLATSMGYDFRDLDDEILKKDGRHETIAALYADLGEAAFRELEFNTLSELKLEDTVLATGGGTIMIDEAIKALKNIGPLVYLKAHFETLQERNQLRDQSGILKAKQDAQKKHHDRHAMCAAYADIVVDVDDKSVEEIVNEMNGLIAVYKWAD